MSSKKNYYSIHPNKTKRKKISRKLSWKTLKTIALATDVVVNAMRLNQILISSSQPMPKYAKGNSESDFRKDGYAVCGGNDKPEIVVDRFGKSKRIQNNISRVFSGNVELIREANSIGVPTVITHGISATEFAKNLKTVADEMRKINPANLKNISAEFNKIKFPIN